MTLFLTALYLLVREVLATPLRSLANDVLAASKASDPFFSLLNLCDFTVPPFPPLSNSSNDSVDFIELL